MNRIMNLYSGCVLAIFVRELAGKSHSERLFSAQKTPRDKAEDSDREAEREREREREGEGREVDGWGGVATTVYRDRASGLIFF